MSNAQIAVLGTGCPSCKKLFELTAQAVQELGLETEVRYITDIQEIAAMGVMHTPAITVNGTPVMTGATNDIEKIKNLLTQGKSDSSEGKPTGCSCRGTH